MDLFHTTDWGKLKEILQSESIAPQEIVENDKTNSKLRKLSNSNTRVIWFSDKNWSHNRFGSYMFQFRSKDLVLPKLVPLGKHNGARCFLSLPPLRAKRVASRLSVGVISSAEVATWQPKSIDDRVDILVSDAVPITTSRIRFVCSERKRDTGHLRRDYFASARFWAKMILEGDHRFDTSATDILQISENVLRWLTGDTEKAFQTAQAKASGKPSLSRPKLLKRALTLLTEDKIKAAAVSSARIGTFSEVADELAVRINTHFPGTNLTGKEILKSCDF